MTRATRASALGLLLLLVDPGPGRAAHAGPPAQSSVITVEMVGFRSDRGRALVGLFDSPKGFPDKGRSAVTWIAVQIRNRKAHTRFPGLPAGTYAIGVLHDEDGDHKMKTGLFGIPREGYGTSRDARGRFGPPRFDDARLSVGSGQTLHAQIRIIYH